jgi:histidine triad (HIT) family protein
VLGADRDGQGEIAAGAAMVDRMGRDCVFCSILTGRADASFVGATRRAVAFLDIRPTAEGHALVVPRRHVDGLAGLDDEEGAELFRLARQIASSQRELGLAEGVNLFLADGEVAGQEVFHAHLHVLARQRGDGLRLRIAYPPPPDRAQLDATAARLRSRLPDAFRS